MCKNTNYILQKPTLKIKQPVVQLAIRQLFQKLKSRSTKKQGIKAEKPKAGINDKFFNWLLKR
jgi:hypothetical protein